MFIKAGAWPFFKEEIRIWIRSNIGRRIRIRNRLAKLRITVAILPSYNSAHHCWYFSVEIYTFLKQLMCRPAKVFDRKKHSDLRPDPTLLT